MTTKQTKTVRVVFRASPDEVKRWKRAVRADKPSEQDRRGLRSQWCREALNTYADIILGAA